MDLLRNMRAFVCVAEEMSYTAAARTLDTSTGAVSRLVSELEQHLATRLLHRTTRQIALTHAGRRYLARCRAILGFIGEAEAEARSIRLEPAGRLKLRASPSIGQHYLIPAIKDYRRKHPAVQIGLTLSDSPSCLLEEGVDAVVVALPALRDSSLVGVSLGETYSVLCAAPGYLDARNAPATLGELAAHEFVSDAPALAESVDLELHGPDGLEHASARPALHVNACSAVATALELGMGIGALPVHAAAEALHSGRLIHVLPHYRIQRLNIYALFASKHYLDAKVRTWLDHMKAFFAETGARHEAILRGESAARRPDAALAVQS